MPKSAIIPFSADGSATKSGKKYNVQLMQEALEEAKFILDGTDGAGVRFYDRMCVAWPLSLVVVSVTALSRTHS